MLFQRSVLAFCAAAQAATLGPKLNARDQLMSSFWMLPDVGTANYVNGDGGYYTLDWTNIGDVVAGKGWDAGTWRSVSYSGSFSPTAGNALLGLYGWTVDPLIEYYVTDNYVRDPSLDASAGFTYHGDVWSDDSNYKIYTAPRTNAGSIEGNNSNFTQFWSIRENRRTGGTITTSNHFNAWASLGMQLGQFDASRYTYQIVATEGLWGSSGSSAINVQEA